MYPDVMGAVLSSEFLGDLKSAEDLARAYIGKEEFSRLQELQPKLQPSIILEEGAIQKAAGGH